MNLSNKLTLSRILIVPFFVVAVTPRAFGIPEQPINQAFSIPGGCYPILRLAALLMFIAASITDYYDGALARKHGWSTNFGKLMDPLADKVLTMTAFVTMVQLELFQAWMVVLILAREFLITGLRQLAMAEGRILGADRWGKNKTIAQLTTIITALVFLAARDWLNVYDVWYKIIVRSWNIEWVFKGILHLMVFFCVMLTTISGIRYYLGNIDIIKSD